MIAWIVVGTSPQIGFYQLARPAGAPDLSYRALTRIDPVRRPLEAGGGTEAVNVAFELDNSDGSLTDLFGDLLLRSATVYYLDDASATKTLLAGTLDSYTIGVSVRGQIIG